MATLHYARSLLSRLRPILRYLDGKNKYNKNKRNERKYFCSNGFFIFPTIYGIQEFSGHTNVSVGHGGLERWMTGWMAGRMQEAHTRHNFICKDVLFFVIIVVSVNGFCYLDNFQRNKQSISFANNDALCPLCIP